MNYWIEVFKVGEHTDAGGDTREWTSDDLQKMVDLYNNQSEDDKHEAPVVVGHPVDNSPAYGWVEQLKTDGKTLFAKLKDLNKEFLNWVEKGLYKKRSISLYPNLLLRHIGFLGGVPPAVKGLADVKGFQEDNNEMLFEFEETAKIKNENKKETKKITNKNKINNFIQGENFMDEEKFNLLLGDVVKFLADTFGEDVANQASGYLTDNKSKYVQVATATAPNTNESEKPKAYQDPKVKELEIEIENLKKENRHKDFTAYVNKLIKEDNKLLPKQLDYAVSLLELGAVAGKIEFAENDKTKEIEGTALVKAFLESLDNKVDIKPLQNGDAKPYIYPEFKEFDVDNERLDLDKKVHEFMDSQIKAGHNIGYMEALNSITKNKE